MPQIKSQDSYSSMFGEGEGLFKEEEGYLPSMLPLSLNENLIKEEMEKAREKKSWVLAFVIGTKPCFYKFYGSIIESDKQGVPNFIINTNQHYDEQLTYGLKEFGLEGKVAVNLSMRGDLAQKSGEMFFKISWFAKWLKKRWPDVTVVPMVLGDTIMTAIVPPAWTFSRDEKAIQNEAGLRGMTPSVVREVNRLKAEEFVSRQFNDKWELLRNEPFPEQWDTYVSAAGSEYLFAPTELNRKHLLREGYPPNKIWVTGGVVVDALELKKKEKPEKSIFSIYPQLEEGEWLRVDIHRRGNLTASRFKAIVKGVKLLVEKGYNVNMVELSATRIALDEHGLRSEIEKLSKHKNFLFTGVWPEYAHVIEFYRSEHCFAPLTDSGGVQEEMNLLNKPVLTARFNTDRPETVMNKSNVLVPPISGEKMLEIIDYVHNNEELVKTMRNSPSIYGVDVGKKTIGIIRELISSGDKPFKWAHEELGLGDEDGFINFK